MNLGEKIFELRKRKNLSQEEVAEILNVTRQTISKWETNQSTPDFDKIIPLCEMYDISADELLTGTKKEQKIISKNIDEVKKQKRTIGLITGILLYFIAISWIMISIPALKLNPIISSAIFMIICGIATCIIIYSSIMYKKEKAKEEKKENKLMKQIEEVLSILTVIIYLTISFITMAWHLTWIIWLLYALIIEIIKLIFVLRGESYEK